MEAERRTGGWTAILPPLVAVLLALFFRRLIVALVSAVVLGALLQTGFNPVAGLQKAAVDYLWGSVADSFSLYIIGFTFCLVGMVHVIIRMGGIAGLLEAFSWLAESARSTRIATSLMGLALFFDDYANTIVVGTTMRPMTDKQKISREKLAYLVDSTSAPIAGIAVISTWIGYEVGLFDELSRQLQMGISGYGIFFEILPLRFYCILTLVFVFMVAIMGRDYGPMLSAERRALHDDEVLRPDSDPLTSSAQKEVEPKEGVPLRWINAVAPVACVLAGALLGMFWSGWSTPQFAGGIPAVDQLLSGAASLGEFRSAWGAALPDLFDWTAWRDALSGAANAKVLFWASIVGSLVSIALAVGQRLLSVGESLQAWSRAIPMMGMAVAILVLAWSIQSVCDDLGTSIYLVGTVQHLISASLLPLLTFGLAAVVAFSTGTSWGTMGILLPAMIPLAFHMTADMPGGEIILFMCFGAVLDGAIFGDHCSPISDTTVMSSIASSVDHMDHVQTQMPYALTSMTVSAAFGYVGVAFGLPIWAAYLLGTVALFGILATLGKDPTKEPA
jgi:Na+/H+ antiporter NhaC